MEDTSKESLYRVLLEEQVDYLKQMNNELSSLQEKTLKNLQKLDQELNEIHQEQVEEEKIDEDLVIEDFESPEDEKKDTQKKRRFFWFRKPLYRTKKSKIVPDQEEDIQPIALSEESADTDDKEIQEQVEQEATPEESERNHKQFFDYGELNQLALVGFLIKKYINIYLKLTRLSPSSLKTNEDESFTPQKSKTRFSFHSILVGNLEICQVKFKNITRKKNEAKDLPQIPYYVVVLKNQDTNEEVSYPTLENVGQQLEAKNRQNPQLEFGEFLVVEQIDSHRRQKRGATFQAYNKICWIVDFISIQKEGLSTGLDNSF